MGRWRGRSRAALVCALGVSVLAAAGCGVEDHANEPRPQTPTRVSVSITDATVTVQPGQIAMGPEPNQQIPQNRNVEQPRVRSNAPLKVVLVAANLTDEDSMLKVSGPGRDAESELLVANGNVSLQTDLPTGVYRISAAGIPDAEPAKLVVGPFRSSSENDLLLP